MSEFHKGDRVVCLEQGVVLEVHKVARKPKSGEIYLFDADSYAYAAIDCIPDADDRPLLMNEFCTLLEMAECLTPEDLPLLGCLTPEQKQSFWSMLDESLRDRLKALKEVTS
jgi:hypothetical protein